MATFIQMVNRIAGDLRRSNISDQIKAAINDAIKEAGDRNDPFWFLEAETGLSLVFGNPEVVGSSAMTDIYWVDVLNPPREQLANVTYEELVSHERDMPQSGRPQIWAEYKGFVRVWPTPDGPYNLVAGGRTNTIPPFPLVADNASNAWTTDAELYIRALAKRNVLRDIIRDFGEARVVESVAEDHRQKLIERSHDRMGSNTLRSTQF